MTTTTHLTYLSESLKLDVRGWESESLSALRAAAELGPWPLTIPPSNEFCLDIWSFRCNSSVVRKKHKNSITYHWSKI